MSLWGGKPRYTYGALRNAQLLPVYFPGWTLRFYIERPHSDETTIYAPVPPRILGKLAIMGAEVVYVDADRSHIPPMMWRFLIADDMSVDVFIVRDSDCRLSDRDFALVSDWLQTHYAFHCIRDHPSHAGYSLLGGLWGGRPRQLRSFVSVPWRDMMMGYRTDYVQDMQFLSNAVWPLVQSHAAYCHDSVSCLDWPASHPFPVPRIGTEHLGQVFDAFGNARDEDLQILLEHRPVSKCSVASNSVTQKIKSFEVNEPRDSKLLKEKDSPDDSVFVSAAETTNAKPTLNSNTVGGRVLQRSKNASKAYNEVLRHSRRAETLVTAIKELLLPLAYQRINQSSAYDSKVQNVAYVRSWRTNSTFAVGDGS